MNLQWKDLDTDRLLILMKYFNRYNFFQLAGNFHSFIQVINQPLKLALIILLKGTAAL